MTRRISLAILLTVWAILIAGCATAYLTMRWVLIDQLDRSMVAKASALPELTGFAGSVADDGEDHSAIRKSAPGANAASTAPPQGDRYVIKNAAGRTISPPAGGGAGLV